MLGMCVCSLSVSVMLPSLVLQGTGPFSHGCFGYRFWINQHYSTMDVVDDGGQLCVFCCLPPHSRLCVVCAVVPSSLRPYAVLRSHVCVCVICALVSFPPVNITITAKGYSYEHEEPLTTLTLTSPFVKSGVVRCQLVVFVWCVQLDVGAAAVVVGVVVFTNVGASLYHH